MTSKELDAILFVGGFVLIWCRTDFWTALGVALIATALSSPLPKKPRNPYDPY
jgi:hypothetical protein